MLTGFAPHRLSVAQQHQASGRNNGSVLASNMIFSHIPTLTDPALAPSCLRKSQHHSATRFAHPDWQESTSITHYYGTMSETPDLESTADRVVAALRNIDGKVNAKRDQRLNDPDSFGDKIFKFAMPTLVGLAFGKVFEMAWKQSVGRKATLPDGTTDARKDAILGIAFAVISAALGALVSQLSDRGSKAIVNHRHAKRR